MFNDVSLEYSKQWATYIGPDIGGPVPFIPPNSFTITPPTPPSNWMAVSINGPGYTCGMAAVHRPLMPVMDQHGIYYSFEFDLMTNTNSTICQVIEFETNYCDENSYYYNMSTQLNYNAGGHIQSYAAPNNVWADTGINPGLLPNNTSVHFKQSYFINTVTRKSTIISLAIGGVVYNYPSLFSNVPAGLRSGWAPGLYTQYQLGLAFAGGTFSIYAQNVKNNWE